MFTNTWGKNLSPVKTWFCIGSEHRDLHLICISIKGKILPVHTIKVQKGSRGIVPLILNLGSGWEWPTSHPGHLIHRMLDGSQNWSEHFWEEKKKSCPCWVSKPRSSSPQPSHYTDCANLTPIWFSKLYWTILQLGWPICSLWAKCCPQDSEGNSQCICNQNILPN